MDQDEPPILTAVSGSARQLYLLLRCIAFSNKAHVQISDIGIKLAVDEASVMEGTYFYLQPSLRPISRLTRPQLPPSSTSLSSQLTPSMRLPHYTTPNTPTAMTNPSHHLLPPQHFRYPFPLSSRPSRSSVSPTPPHPSHHGRATLLTRPAQPLQETTY